MTENPEIRAKILDWQKRYNIQDGDPAIALLELVELMDRGPRPGGAGAAAPNVTANVSGDALSEAMKTALLPVTERLAFQAQELQQKLEAIDFDKFVKQIEGYHEGIDYCTKKLDVIKKETDAIVIKIAKTSAQISPITRGAVMTLMAGAGLLGYIIRSILT
jgi:soluble cytochrome b562